MNTEDATPSARLARLVRERREALDLTQRGLADDAGLGLSTIQSIERGNGGTPARATRDGLERGLRWRKGSVLDILAGKPPVAVTEQLFELEQSRLQAFAQVGAATARVRDAREQGDPTLVKLAEAELEGARLSLDTIVELYERERHLIEQVDAAEIESIPDAVLIRELERRLAQRHAPAFDDEPPVGGSQYDFDLAAHTDPPGYVRDGDREVPPDEGA